MGFTRKITALRAGATTIAAALALGAGVISAPAASAAQGVSEYKTVTKCTTKRYKVGKGKRAKVRTKRVCQKQKVLSRVLLGFDEKGGSSAWFTYGGKRYIAVGEVGGEHLIFGTGAAGAGRLNTAKTTASCVYTEDGEAVTVDGIPVAASRVERGKGGVNVNVLAFEIYPDALYCEVYSPGMPTFGIFADN